jgi:pimeloyl-ACP methyl ester carboxylesterase
VTLRNLLLAALAICAAGRAAAADKAAAAAALDVPSASYTHPQQLVAIDGARRLNLFCLGSGSPTVLFEAGLGSTTSTWRHVQGQVATFTRACSYDRAGFGFSDPSTRAGDATNVVDDLQHLITAAPIATPIVFVGHSIGGLFGTLFAASHKAEVAGMVLVDPAFAHQWEDFAAHGSSAETGALYATFREMTDGLRKCQALIRAAAPGAPPSAQEADCLPSADMPEHPDNVLLATMTQQWMRPSQTDAMLSEAESFNATTEGGGNPAADDDELDSASGNLAAMPLVVLTAGRTMASFPGLNDTQRAQFKAAWNAGHDALAHRSTQGKNIAVPESGHFIQIDQPAVVVDAIRGVVEAVRGSK